MARPKKITRFSVREFKNVSGNLSYRVVGHKLNGERVRQNFPSRHEAEQERADLEAEASGQPTTARIKRTRLTDDQLADAEAAIKTAGERKIADIVSHFLEIEKRLRTRGIEVDSAVSFAESHYRRELISVSILNAHTEFIQSRSDKEARTKSFYESTLRLLLKPDPNKELHTFTISDLEKILSLYKNPNTKRAYRTALSVFFNWAVRHHYCLEDPCKRLDKLPKDMTQIAMLSLEEVTRLLYAAMNYQDGISAAPVVIGLFAGLRPSEIRGLKPEDIGKDKIRVSGGKLRRKLKRTPPIPPVLAAWLKKYPFTGLPTGWDYKMKALKKATKAAKWVQDVIRHTSISFQTERDKNEALTAYNCGTSIKMMNQHYRNTIDNEKSVKAFWNLTPAKLKEKKLEIVLPGTPRVKWPVKKALEKLVWQKPLVHTAKDIGVSDVALRKHCVKLGISLPSPGHWVRQRRYHSSPLTSPNPSFPAAPQ